MNGRADRKRAQERDPVVRPPRRADGVSASATARLQTPLELYRPDLAGRLTDHGSPLYRQNQVYEHLLRRPFEPFSRATALPGEIRRSLDDLGVATLELRCRRSSSDGTTKLLSETRDGSLIETVVMPYKKRTTVCISSQIGCPVGCAFCATGNMGFKRNLSVAEIVDQVRLAASLCREDCGRISNLVYMGMGEPLLNVEAVLGSIRILTDERGLDLSHRAVSVSTVGIPAGILKLGRTEPQVNLALSLHASTDGTRALLIPKTHLHPLSEVLTAAWQHFTLTHRKLLVEYVLLGGVNDSEEDAKRLAALLRGHVVTVNLLSWNPIGQSHAGKSSAATLAGRRSSAPIAFGPSSPRAVAAFRAVLLGAHLEAVVRRGRGGDIEAACGQLAARRQAYGQAQSE